MRTILFDTPLRHQLFPFTAIRPVADLLTGILTMRERWEMISSSACDVLTESYLTNPHESATEADSTLYINAHLFPDEALRRAILELQAENAITDGENIIACRTVRHLNYPMTLQQLSGMQLTEAKGTYKMLDHPCRLFEWNKENITHDFDLLTYGRKSAHISETNKIIGRENIFFEQGAVVEYCIINATAGPVYIGKNSNIMEGCIIRGPFALLDGAALKMGTTVYGATTIGQYCVAGGEIKNAVMMPYSNKAHHGYLGDAVIGSWCNIGAGTSCSNIKNTAGNIRIWNPMLHRWLDAGKKCGVLMGDFSRAGINSSINTGTVVGISANMVSSSFTPKFIDSFTWNLETGERYILEKVFSDIDNWMKLKHQSLTSSLRNILTHLYNQSKHEKTDRSS